MFRNVAEFEALTGDDAPTTAEKRLIEATKAGEPCVLCDPANPSRPEAPSDTTRIRAPLLRHLILGGTPDCGLHESGVTLIGGWIEGELDLSYCTARGQTLLNACHFTERPIFYQSHLRQLDLDGSHLPGLMAQGARIDGGLFLRTLTATGTIAVNGAQIGRAMSCEGATLDGNGGKALNAQGVTIKHNLFLRTVTATGTIAVNSAHIGGQLNCTAARLDGNRGKALNAQGAVIKQSLFLSSVTATGMVTVNAAQIDGQLDCTNAILDGNGGDALNAQGVTIKQDLFVSTVTATGTVDVNGAQIGGQMSFTDATLDGNGGDALNAQGVIVRQDLFLRNVTANGTVDVNGAQIDGQMDCRGSSLDGKGEPALRAERLNVAQGLFFVRVKKVTGPIIMTAAHVGDLCDDEASWPSDSDSLILDGFNYDRINATSPLTLNARRKWLEAGSDWRGEFNPQPFTQFAKVLRQMGYAVEARRVLIERTKLQGIANRKARKSTARVGKLSGLRSLWASIRNVGSYVLDRLSLWMAGYGQDAARSLWWLAGLLLVATILANRAWDEGSFAPNSAVVLVSPGWELATAKDCFPAATAPADCTPNPAQLWSDTFTARDGDPTMGADWDSFNRYAYAADLVVPFLDLGQTAAWAPSKDRGVWGWVLWWARWVLATLGWVVTGLGVAAVTGVMQRNQPD